MPFPIQQTLGTGRGAHPPPLGWIRAKYLGFRQLGKVARRCLSFLMGSLGIAQSIAQFCDERLDSHYPGNRRDLLTRRMLGFVAEGRIHIQF